MKYYVVAELDVTDPGWVPAYVQHTTKLVEEHGGRYLARTPNLERLEGDRRAPQISLLIEWPSREAAMAFYECDEYRSHREARRDGSSGEFLLVAGEDINGVANVPGQSAPGALSAESGS